MNLHQYFRFSLKDLIWLTTLVAVLLGWYLSIGRRQKEERRLKDEIQQRDARIAQNILNAKRDYDALGAKLRDYASFNERLEDKLRQIAKETNDTELLKSSLLTESYWFTRDRKLLSGSKLNE